MKEIEKGDVMIQFELKDIMWDELVELLEYLQDNPLGAVAKVIIGDQTFDA